MLDVGCNKGYLGMLARDRYEYVLGFDVDEACIAAAPTTVPGLNFACFGMEHLRRREPIPICERFHADVVVALAMTHHLAKAGWSVSEVVDILDGLARRHLLIEDIVDVPAYSSELERRGFRVSDHRVSYPTDRTLTLWSRA